MKMKMRKGKLINSGNVLFDKIDLLRIIYHAEDCNFVIEGIPSKPYNSLINNYNQVQLNMKLRLV